MRPNRENSIVSSSQPNLVCRPSGTPGHSSHENVNRAEQNTADAGSTSSNQSSEQCRRCSSINSRKWGGRLCASYSLRFHLSCSGMSRRQSTEIIIWKCSNCLAGGQPICQNISHTIPPNIMPKRPNSRIPIRLHFARCSLSHC